jgi:flagellar hook assembly protein FlgD
LKLRLLCAAVALAVALGAAASDHLISSVQIDNFVISPDGDGVKDSLTFTYALSDTATSVYVLVLAKDSITVVDTLVAGDPDSTGGGSVAWHGLTSGGTPAPEDSYVVFIRVEDALGADSTYRTVVVDLTPPTVVITNFFPNPFGPGAPNVGHSKLTVEFDVSDPYPGPTLVVSVKVRNPLGSVVTLIEDSVVATTSSINTTWNGSGSGTSEGDYTVIVEASDQAGFQVEDRATVVVDRIAPTVAYTQPPLGRSFMVMPDSLFGWAWDLTGIQDLEIRYASVEPFVPITNTWMAGDTVKFGVVLADSFSGEEQRNINVRAVDMVGRETLKPIAFTLDTTAPGSLTLEQPRSTTRSPVIMVNGALADSAGTSVIRFFRDGTAIDSVHTAVRPFLPRELRLAPGLNRITARAVDSAGNEGAPSNEIQVTFQEAAGLVIEQPFVPGASFRLMLAQEAARVTLNIYDLGGQLVESLRTLGPGTEIIVSWDGTNGNFEIVKRGPLVAVAVVDYVTGGSDVFREIFLFQP